VDRPRTEGERWVRAELERLLDARFAPGAVAGFLVASQRRAGAVRRARPALARQEARWLALGAGAYAGAGIPARRWVPWWALTALMLDWHLGMVETEDGRPRPLGAADALTLGRVWLAVPAATAPRAWHAPAAFTTDALDGRLARASVPTRAGRDLEGLADAAFAAAMLRGLHREGRLPPAAVAAELARLAVGVGYALWCYFGTAERPDEAVVRAGRVTTPLRAAGLLAAAAGRPRTGVRLLLSGSALSVGAVAVAVARRGG
jgi:phosphatidylglycerophosphate synthase